MKKNLLVFAFFSLYALSSFAQFPDNISATNLPSANGMILEVIDFDNDGYEDVVYQNGLNGNIDLYKNTNGSFRRVNSEMSWPVIPGAGDGSEGVISFDYNGDGFQDILLVRSGISGYFRLFKNDCSRSFTEVSSAALLPPSARIAAQHLTLDPMVRIVDYDKDNDNDIVYGRIGTSSNAVSVLENAGGFFLSSRDLIGGLPVTTIPWFVTLDVENDQDDDLVLILNTGASNSCAIELYQNNGFGTYTVVSSPGFTNSSPVGFATVFDYNRDGFADLLLGTKEVVLPGPGNSGAKVFRNNSGNLTFTDVTTSFNTYTGTDAGDLYNAHVFDLNNDGDMDVLWETNRNSLGTSRPAIMNNNGLNVFNNIRTSVLPLALTTTGYTAHYVVFDYDRDGFLDIFKPGTSTQPASMYRNNNSPANRYIDIRLQTCSGQGEAHGATVFVKSGSLRIFQFYNSEGISSATSGKSENLHFGLGSNTLIDSLVIIWPNGTPEVWRTVSTNQLLTITDGTCAIGQPMTFDLGSDSASICNQDTAYLFAPWGYETYFWSTGDATLETKVTQSGWYYCTVTNTQGCSASDSLYVSFGIGRIVQNDTLICGGSSLTLSALPRYDCSPFGAPVKSKHAPAEFIPGLTYIDTWNGHHYYQIDLPGTWSDAEQTALSLGGHLAVINSQEENDFIMSSPQVGNSNLWIGLYRGNLPSDQFTWVNCQPVNYTNWALSIAAPTTVPDEQHVYMRGNGCPDGGQWKNTNENLFKPDPCESNFFGLIEFDEAYNVDYLWSTNDTTVEITVKPNSSINYVLSVTQAGATCFGNINIEVINPNSLILEDTITECKANSIRVDAVPGMLSYNWSTGSTNSFTNVFIGGANRWIKVSAMTPEGCIGNDSVFVNLSNSTILTPDTAVCLGETVQLTGPVATGYLWSTGATTQNILVTPGPGENYYWVRIPLGTTFCYDTVKVITFSGQLDGPLFSSDSLYICNANSTSLSMPNGYTNYSWSTGDMSQTAKFFNEGWYTGYAETATGCFNADSIYVTKTIITLNPNRDTTVCKGKSINYSANLHNACNPFGPPLSVGYTPGSAIPGYTYLGEYRSHHYYVADNRSTWSQAAQDALNSGGFLAIVNDTAEQRFLTEIADRPVWLGLYRNPLKGYFGWMNCDTLTYSEWADGEPAPPPGDFVFMLVGNCPDDKKWFAHDDDDQNPPNPCVPGIFGLLEMDPVNTIYQWSNGSAQPTTTIVANSDTSIQLTLVKDYNGTLVTCNSNRVNILTLAVPSTPEITGRDSVCASTLAAYSTVSNAGHSYRWIVTGGTVTSGQGTATVTVSWIGVGTGTIQVIDTLVATKCTAASAIKSVVKNPNPTPVVTGPNSVCENSSATYSTPAAGGHTFLWTVVGGVIASGQGTTSITVNWGISGPGSVRVLDSIDATGCKANSPILNVTKNLAPTPLISGLAGVCENAIEPYSTPGTVGHTYRWLVVGGTIVGGQGTSSINVLWGTAGSGFVNVMDSVNATGCFTNAAEYQVTINPQPAPVVSGNQIVCANTNSVYTTPFATGHTYLWTLTGGSIIAGQGTANLIVQWGAAGMGTIWVSDSLNGIGCKGNSPILNVTIDNIPSPVVMGTSQICEGQSAGYTTSGSVGHSYVWTVVGGSIIAGQGSATIQVTWPSTPGGTVRVLDSAIVSGCKGNSPVFNVTVSPNPIPVISGETQVCEFSNDFYQTPFDADHSYTWYVSGGTIVSGQGTNAIEVNWGTAGLGAISLLDSNNLTGCVGNAGPYNVSINIIPNPVVLGPDRLCGTPVADYQVVWNLGRTYDWLVTGGTILSGQGSETVTVQWDGPGIGTITVLDSNIFTTCHTLAAPLIVYISAPPVAIISGASEICEDGVTSFGTIPGITHYFEWGVLGGTILSGQGTERIYVHWPVAGQGIVGLKDSVIGTGCLDMTYRIINIRPLPTAHFNLFQSGGTIILTPTQAGNSYTWYFGDGDSSLNQIATHSYLANGIYTVSLHARSTYGCTRDSSMVLDMQLVGLASQPGGGNHLSVFPNPFNQRTQIQLTLKNRSEVTLEVYDLTGRLIKRFTEKEWVDAGEKVFVFDANEAQAASAIYLIRLQVDEEVSYQRIVETSR